MRALAIDLSTRGATVGQQALALLVLVLVLVALAAAAHRSRFLGLPAGAAQRARGLYGSRAAADPETVRIERGVDRSTIEARIRSVLSTQPRGSSPEDTGPSRPPTLFEAAGEVRTAVGDVWSDRLAGIPRLTLRIVEEAVPIAVLGSVAVVSIETWRRWASKGDGADLESWVEEAAIQTEAFLIEIGALATSYPFLDTIWSLVFANIILTGDWLYRHPLVIAGALVGLAVVVLVIERWFNTETAPLYPDRWRTGLRAAGAAAGFWIAGIVPTKLGATAGQPQAGAVVGLALSLAVAGVLSWLAVRDLIRRLWARDPVRERVDDRPLRQVVRAGARRVVLLATLFGGGVALAVVGSSWVWAVGVIVAVLAGVVSVVLVIWRLHRRGWGIGAFAAAVRRTTAIAGVAAMPFLVAYAVVVVGTGKGAAVVDAVLSGSLTIRTLVAAAVIGVLALLVRDARDAWGEVRQALREAFSKGSVRGVLIARAAPLAVVGVGYIAGIGFGLPVIPAAFAGVLAGVAARGLAIVCLRIYRTSRLRESSRSAATRAIVSGYVLDRDDDTVFWTTVNTVPVAATDRERCVRGAADVAEQLFDAGVAEPSVERRFADVVWRGVEDCAETRAVIERDIDDDLRAVASDGVDVDELEQEFDGYPESVWRDRLWTLRGRGVVRQTGDRVYYRG
jgi:hypothetical protein